MLSANLHILFFFYDPVRKERNMQTLNELKYSQSVWGFQAGKTIIRGPHLLKGYRALGEPCAIFAVSKGFVPYFQVSA
jgi:hypothetical protein